MSMMQVGGHVDARGDGWYVCCAMRRRTGALEFEFSSAEVQPEFYADFVDSIYSAQRFHPFGQG